MENSQKKKKVRLREILHEIIYEADTPAGKAFDIGLLIIISASVLTVMLETVESLHDKYKEVFFILEWTFTIIFTIEYLLRIYAVYRPWRYITSTWGIIDLISFLPTYIGLFLPVSNYFMTIRGLRLLRIFRILKLTKYLKEGRVIITALQASQTKITVFLFFILLSVTLIGSLMYLVEGGADSGFSSIPRSIYWAIVTITTVGYGDIHPKTDVGQFLAAIVMILGYAVLAVPTGIVSSEMISAANADRKHSNTQACRYCSQGGHDDDALYCKYCGEVLNE